MPILKVSGCNLYYEIHGQGPPLVMIMGLRRNMEWWYHQIPVLAQSFTVIAFDNRGAGRSDKPEMEYSIPMFAEDTAGLMKELKIDRAHMLGISMGGYITQEFAIRYPEMTNGMVLGCTSCGGEKAVLMSQERMDKFTANQGLTPEQILKKDMDIYFSDEYIEANPAEIAQFEEISMRYYQPADAFMRQFNACLAHDTVERISKVDIPAMIMTGDDDPLVPPENSYILDELMPNSELSIFKKGRHAFFMEFSKRFNREVIEFFKSLSPE